jgi:hypothetical protein
MLLPQKAKTRSGGLFALSTNQIDAAVTFSSFLPVHVFVRLFALQHVSLCVALSKRMLMCAVIPLTHPLIQHHTGMRTEPVAVLVCALMCAMHAVSQPASTLRLRDAKVRHTCILNTCIAIGFVELASEIRSVEMISISVI